VTVKTPKQTGGFWGPWLILPALVMIYAANPGPLAVLRTHVLDAVQYLNSPTGPDASVVTIVDLDERSQHAFGQWPWPRSRLADLVNRLVEAGAATIVIDSLFPEADRMGAQEDRQFAQAIAHGPLILSQVTGLDPAIAVPARATFINKGADWHPFVQPWPGVIGNIDLLTQAASGIGFISIAQENDGVVRRLPLLFRAGGSDGVALSIEAVRLYLKQASVTIQADRDGIHTITIGAIMVPTDAQGRLWLSLPNRLPRHISAADILTGGPPADLKGRIILIGSSAEGLLDLRTLADSRRVPGVDIHAFAIDAMLGGQVVTRPAFAPALELLALGICGCVLLWVVRRTGSMGLNLAVLGLVSAQVLGAVLLFWAQHWLIDGVTPALGIVLFGAGLNISRWRGEEQKRRELRRAFDHYLTPDMIERLIVDPNALRLGGEIRPMTVLFADIRGFTALAESLGPDPAELTRILNRAFSVMTKAVQATGGTIDKLVGDCLVAFWNAPLDQPDHAERALRAARAIIKAMADLTDPALQIGIGVNTGPCFVGNMGSDNRFNYTAMGDPVNIASRLEAATKDHGVSVLIGAATAQAAPNAQLISIGHLTLRGRREALEAFTFRED
jgi:adenylate cyclase